MPVEAHSRPQLDDRGLLASRALYADRRLRSIVRHAHSQIAPAKFAAAHHARTAATRATPWKCYHLGLVLWGNVAQVGQRPGVFGLYGAFTVLGTRIALV